MNGRSACASSRRDSSLGLRARPPAILSTLASPSMPGLRNSNRLHNSPRWFSTGVPLSASRCVAAQQADGLGGRGVGVLDGLRFVEHHVIELDFGELRGVANQRAVRGQDEVVLARSARCRAPGRCAPGRGAAA